jgi:hypothetical protein
MPPAIKIMRQRAGADFAEAIQLRHPLHPNHNITITHILETTKEARGENPSAFGAPGVYSNILLTNKS